MKISENGISHIKKWEGLRLHAYKCSAGKDTIGYGHLITPSEKKNGLIKGINYLHGIKDAQATEILLEDVHYAVKAVTKIVKVPLSQNQFDALVSFTFNLGVGSLRSSTLLKKLNAGDYASIPNELMRWVKVRKNGVLVKSKGLINRRRAEAKLWRDAEIKPIHKSRTNQGIAAVATGQVINYIEEATAISKATNGLAVQFGGYAQWVGIALTLAGIAYVLYARWDDRRHGIK